MTHRYLHCLLLAAVSSIATQGQDVLHFALDTVGSTGAVFSDGRVLQNGDLLLKTDQGNASVLWAGAPTGAPQWQRQVQPKPAVVVATPADGAWLAAVGPQIMLASSPFDVDTAQYSFDLARLDATGTLSTNIRYSFQAIDMMHPPIHLSSRQVQTDDLGNVFILFMVQSGTGGYMLNKIAADGTPIWSRYLRFRFPFGWYIGWPMDPGDPLAFLAPDGAGGCYVVHRVSSSIMTTEVVSIDADGGLLWGKTIRYVNAQTSYDLEFGTAKVHEGRLLIFNHMGLPNGAYDQLIQLQPDGSLYGAELHSPASQVRTTHAGPDGTLYVLGATTVRTLAPGSGNVSEPVAFHELSTNGTSEGFKTTGIAHHAGRLVLPGYRKTTHDLFEYQNWFPGVLSVDLSAGPVPGCMVSPGAMVQRHLVPDSMITITAMDMQTLEAHLTVEAGGFTVEDRTPLTTHTACSITMGLEQPVSSDAPRVINTLLQAGEPLRIEGNGVLWAEVLDLQGRSVSAYRMLANGPVRTLPTDGWVAGTYLVRLSTAQGALQHTQRVVVTGHLARRGYCIPAENEVSNRRHLGASTGRPSIPTRS